jgi:hypothetical protein
MSEQSLLLTRIATMESVLLCRADEKTECRFGNEVMQLVVTGMLRPFLN